MKILSKYKDYYDYMVGYYGIDPKLVLDRRGGKRMEFMGPQPFTIAICGKMLHGFYDGENCYYGEGLLKLGEEVETWRYKHGKEKVVRIKYMVKDCFNSETEKTVNITKNITETDLNDEHGCPIMLVEGAYGGYDAFPRLEDYSVGSVFSADEMFVMLSTWLSTKITEAENIVDKRSDEMKLESKGFNKKCSFRPKMKSCD